jgi:hypothetical protein
VEFNDMKNIVAHAVGLALLATAGYVSAQTCAAPTALNGHQGISGNTCNGTNIIGTYCDVANAPQKEDIYSVTLASASATITLNNTTGAGYTPALVLFQGTCINGSNCAANSAPTTDGGNATLATTGVSDGAYFLAVTADPNASSTNCGAYNLTWTGTLPVKLQDFSVD